MMYKGKCSKLDPASTQAFPQGLPKEGAPNQLQPPNELFFKKIVKENAANQLQPPNERFLKDL